MTFDEMERQYVDTMGGLETYSSQIKFLISYNQHTISLYGKMGRNRREMRIAGSHRYVPLHKWM